MASTQYTPEARQDLKDIAIWIGRHDKRPKVAAKIIRELKSRCDEYARAASSGSLIGTSRPEIGAGYRVFSYKRWVVVFRGMVGGIEVVRVVDGARDFGRLFGGN